eukprot:TRINITY_DN24631_c0_g5_i1.p1 TRINITY_DN24631_c0_g5~~TRINITY_DN24631_c0_g5_i1.p1  ORF type:complete len:488 (-),score=85.43 TRINITY_DN24631_c0_g5_i1:41-1426(-)
MSNYFSTGVDDMGFAVQHTFGTSEAFGGVGGSSMTKKGDTLAKDQVLIRTCLKKPTSSENCKQDYGATEKHFDECCFKVYEPGETVHLKVSEWLMLAGISLDQRNEASVERDAITGLYPYRRVSGANLRIYTKYYGDVRQNQFRCDMEVTAKDSWNSAGSETMPQTAYQGIGGQAQTGQVGWFETYRRGIRFEFQSQGKVSSFDWYTLIGTIVSGFVFISVTDELTWYIACYAVPQGHLYEKVVLNPFSYDLALAKFGVNAALACQVFKMWGSTGSDGRPGVSKEQFLHVFNDCFRRPEVAEELRTITWDRVQDKFEDGSISCRNFVDLMSNSILQVDDVLKHSAMERDSGVVLSAIRSSIAQVAPKPPEKAEEPAAEKIRDVAAASPRQEPAAPTLPGPSSATTTTAATTTTTKATATAIATAAPTAPTTKAATLPDSLSADTAVTEIPLVIIDSKDLQA